MNELRELLHLLLMLPEQASTVAGRVDRLHYIIILTTMGVATVIFTVALVFVVRFRRRSESEPTPRVVTRLGWEVLFIGTPLVVFVSWFFIGYHDFIHLNTPPPGAMDVYVTGKQWMWKFTYPEGPTFYSALTYNRLFTLHGVTMVWLFMIPAIPSAFGNFLLPLMLGAKDVAFPRLNLASVYLYVVGALVTLLGMLWGGADTGWTFYTPYSTTSPTAITPVLLGVFIIGFSTILTGINFIVTTHTLRAPGLRWTKLPLFVWALYGTSIIQVVATPVLGMVLMLVALERVLGVGLFDPARGGDPLLFQHMFWFYSHPAVYIMVLPAMGVITETVCAFSRKNIFAYWMMAMSTFGIAFVGFFTWGHHMFVAGQSTFGSGVFGVLSMFVAIFTAIKIFTWVATLYRGSIVLRAPLLYVLGFIFLLMFGGMTGVAVATTSLDVHWHDTYFIVAHFHYIMVGAVLMAFLAALHYWWPKMFGRMYPERWSLLAAVTLIFGFIVTFLPQFLLGNLGMPRRYFEYPEEYQALNVLSSAGASLLGIGFVMVAAYLLLSLRYGPVSPVSPWGSRGYEWYSGSPPAPHNFTSPPRFDRDAHDYTVPEAPHAF